MKAVLQRLRGLWAILIAMLVGAGLFVLADANPLQAYAALLSGAFLDYYGIASTLVRFCPILLVSLAVIVPLRAGFFNIGGEGQVYIGALLGTVAALYLPEAFPSWVRLPAIILAGAIGGGLWALVPAMLKVYKGTNEIITSLLLSYVAIYLVGGIIQVYLMEPGAAYPYTREIPPDVILPVFLPHTEAHVGILAALVLAVVCQIVLVRTSFGLSIRLVGSNRVAAAYSGLDIHRVAIGSFMIGGAMAGLAGILEIVGVKYRLFDQFSPGYGFQGAIVAFLAGLNPIYAILGAFFLAGLQAGAASMQRTVGVDTMMVEALQGLIVLFVAIGLALSHKRRFIA